MYVVIRSFNKRLVKSSYDKDISSKIVVFLSVVVVVDKMFL